MSVARQRFVDLSGQTFGAWRVIRRADNTDHGIACWLCEHTCGGQEVIQGIMLRRAPPISCLSCSPGKRRQSRERFTAQSRERSGVRRRPVPLELRRICVTCANLPDRRDPDGCVGCGKPFEARQPVVLELATPRSGLGRAEDFGSP